MRWNNHSERLAVYGNDHVVALQAAVGAATKAPCLCLVIFSVSRRFITTIAGSRVAESVTVRSIACAAREQSTSPYGMMCGGDTQTLLGKVRPPNLQAGLGTPVHGTQLSMTCGVTAHIHSLSNVELKP